MLCEDTNPSAKFIARPMGEAPTAAYGCRCYGSHNGQPAAGRAGNLHGHAVPRAHQGARPALGGLRHGPAEAHHADLHRQDVGVRGRRRAPEHADLEPRSAPPRGVVARADRLPEARLVDRARRGRWRRRRVGAARGPFQADDRRPAVLGTAEDRSLAAVAGQGPVHRGRRAHGRRCRPVRRAAWRARGRDRPPGRCGRLGDARHRRESGPRRCRGGHPGHRAARGPRSAR